MNGLTSVRNPRGEGRIAQKAIEDRNEPGTLVQHWALHTSEHTWGVAGEMGPISKLLPLQVPEPYFDPQIPQSRCGEAYL